MWGAQKGSPKHPKSDEPRSLSRRHRRIILQLAGAVVLVFAAQDYFLKGEHFHMDSAMGAQQNNQTHSLWGVADTLSLLGTASGGTPEGKSEAAGTQEAKAKRPRGYSTYVWLDPVGSSTWPKFMENADKFKVQKRKDSSVPVNGAVLGNLDPQKEKCRNFVAYGDGLSPDQIQPDAAFVQLCLAECANRITGVILQNSGTNVGIDTSSLLRGLIADGCSEFRDSCTGPHQTDPNEKTNRRNHLIGMSTPQLLSICSNRQIPQLSDCFIANQRGARCHLNRTA
jgi:hypothetical protein